MLFYKIFAASQSSEWVVFVHGAGGSSAVWFKQLRAFQKEFNVLLVDLRGHGRSNDYHGEGAYSIEAISQDVLKVLDKESIKSAHFVGVSLGTILIRTIVEMAPERALSAVYAGAVAGFTKWARILIVAGQSLKYLVPFETLYAIFAWIIMPGKKAAEARKVFIRESRRVAPEEFRRWLGLIPSVSRKLQKWASVQSKMRSLYLMGSRDYMFLSPAKKVVARTPNSHLQVIDGVGHVCNIERPEVFNEIAIAFLKRTTSTSAA